MGGEERRRWAQSSSPGPLGNPGHPRKHVLEVEVPLHVPFLQNTVGAQLKVPPTRATTRPALAPPPPDSCRPHPAEP